MAFAFCLQGKGTPLQKRQHRTQSSPRVQRRLLNQRQSPPVRPRPATPTRRTELEHDLSLGRQAPDFVVLGLCDGMTCEGDPNMREVLLSEVHRPDDLAPWRSGTCVCGLEH